MGNGGPTDTGSGRGGGEVPRRAERGTQVVGRHRLRYWIELALSGTGASLLALTILVPDWIERVLGLDPDAHSGLAELAVMGLLLAATIVFGVLARLEWSRPRMGAPAEIVSSSQRR